MIYDTYIKHQLAQLACATWALKSKATTNSISIDIGHLQPVHTTDYQLQIYNCLPQCSLNRINQQRDKIETIKQK